MWRIFWVGLIFFLRLEVDAGTSRMSGQHETYLDSVNKDVHFLWSFNATHIDVQVTVKTLGWFAIGISPDGHMDKSDMFVAWVNDTTGEAVIQDRWIDVNTTARRVNLKLDAQQDWMLVGGVQTTTDTTIRAVRALVTCDTKMDRPFDMSTLRIIWASHAIDPPDPMKIPHHQKRGGKSMLMFSSSFLRVTPAANSTDTTKEITLKMDQTSLPGDTSTLTQCRLVKLPKFEKKMHIISTRPTIQPGNEASVQRILVYLCKSAMDEKWSGKNFDCRSESSSLSSSCNLLLSSWANGGGVFAYPEEAGMPLNPEDSEKYVLLEVLYQSTPNITNTFNDSSGMVLTTTEILRHYDAGIMTTGLLQYDYQLTIPPNLDSMTFQAHSMGFCTQTFPATGINVFAVLPLQHKQGIKFTLRHIRNGKELVDIMSDDNPNVLYHEVHPTRSLTTIFPDDRIMVECKYTSKNKSTPTFGGYGMDEEICLAYLSYYPAINVTTSGSMINTRRFLEVTDYTPAMSASQSASMDDVLRQDVQNSSYLRTYYSTKYTWNTDNTNKLLKFYQEEDQLGICLGTGADSMKSIHPKAFVPIDSKTEPCIGKSSLQVPPSIVLTSAMGTVVGGEKGGKSTVKALSVTVQQGTTVNPGKVRTDYQTGNSGEMMKWNLCGVFLLPFLTVILTPS